MRLEDDDIDAFVLSMMKTDVSAVPLDSQGIRDYMESGRMLRSREDIDRFVAARATHISAGDGDAAFNLSKHYRHRFASACIDRRRSIEKNIELLWEEAQALAYTNDAEAWARFVTGESELDSRGRFMGRCGEGEPNEEEMLNAPRILCVEPGLIEATDPSLYHYSSARQALEDERADLKTAEESGALDRLARELFKATAPLLLSVGLHDGARYPRDTEDPSEDGMLHLDAKLARHLETFGECGKEAAGHLRQKAKQRFSDWTARHAVAPTPDKARADLLFRVWLRPAGFYFENGEKADFSVESTRAPYLVLLARVLWRDRIESCAQASDARVLVVRTSDGAEHAWLDKPMIGAAWAIGAPGSEVEGQEIYAENPRVNLCQVPRSWALLNREALTRPFQTLLPIPSDETLPLVTRALGGERPVLSYTAAKVLVCLQATRPTDWARVNLALLARWAWPTKKRIQLRDYQDMIGALWELRDLALVLPNGIAAFPLTFDSLPADRSAPNIEAPFIFRAGVEFRRTVLEGQPNLKGEFTFNFTVAMSLPGTKSHLLRLHLFNSALWNDYSAVHDFSAPGDFRSVPLMTLEEIATQTNSLRRGAVRYRSSDRGKRSLAPVLSQDLGKLRDGLEELCEEWKALRLEKEGDRYRVMPPEAWIEARTKRRKGQARPKAD